MNRVAGHALSASTASAAVMSRALALAGGGGILATAVALAAPLWWMFELVTHFRVQLVAGLTVVATVYAWRREWPWVAALAAAVAVNALPLVPYLTAVPAAGAAGALSFVGVNVQATNEVHEGLVEVLAQTNPDVVVIVEFTQAWGKRLAAVAKGYPYRLEHPRDDAFGIAVWSRLPMRGHDIDLAAAGAVDAVLETPQGAVRLYGVHLLPPTSAARAAGRNAQLERLAARVAASPEPVIVIGDFNLTPFSPYFTRWQAQSGLVDARRGFGIDFTWPTFFPLLGIAIDHCFVSGDLEVAEYRRLPAFGSDHYPVLVRIG